MEASLPLYRDVLGYDKVIYDETAHFDDLPIRGGKQKFRRVLLGHSKDRIGPFAPWLGHTEIELFQKMENEGRKIYEGRI
jgi:hypothetical protein